MLKEEIHILPTPVSPEVIINPEGIIKIKGRALMVNYAEITEQIMNGIEVYLKYPPETTYFIIAFEYLNSFSARFIASLINKLSQRIAQPKKLTIRWYYEEDDEDMLETGKNISEVNEIPIEFTLTENITNL